MMPRFARTGALLCALTAFVAPTLAVEAYTTTNNETPKDNNANCSCYVVSSGAQSTTPEYFQYYRFYDFRNLPDGMKSPPPKINATQNASNIEYFQPKTFTSDAFTTDWGVQNWTKKASEDFPTPMANSYANVYIGQEGNGTFLSLRTTKLNSSQTSAEIENHQKNLMHVSMRMSARVTGDKGAVAGFFTFFDDSNESDIEILTNDPKDKIRYTNQPALDKQGNEVQAASVAPANLPRWDEWREHRIDWLPKNSYWYLDNKQVAANTYSVPRKPSFLVLNMWSDGGEWSGNMTVGGQAEFQIQWIEMTFNTSGPYTGAKSRDDSKRSVDFYEKEALEKRKGGGCVNVCKIDGVERRGTPEIVSSVSGAASVSMSWGAVLLVGLISAFSAL